MHARTTSGRRLLVAWDDPATAATDDAGEPDDLPEGGARMAVRRVALTANNVTYALLAQAFGYGRFFPAPKGQQLVPAWGFADCVVSDSDDVAVGERVWGFWPLAEQVDLVVGRADEDGFSDVAEHRSELPSFYNRYDRAPRSVAAERERAVAVHRPLFATGWLLARHVEGLLPEGGVAVVSSASSRTGTATGWCLAAGDPEGDGPRIDRLALTSAGKVAFTEGVGPWDRVVAYDDVAALAETGGPAVFVDLRGDASVRAAVHEALGPDGLAASLVVGRTAWDAGDADVPPPRPTLFFAPTVAATQAQERGPSVLRDELVAGLERYLADDASAVDVEVVDGDGLSVAWRRLVAGELPPGTALALEW